MKINQRRERLNQIRSALLKIKKQGKEPSYEKMISYCCDFWEVTRRTAKEYIDTVKESAFCKQEKIKFAK